MDSMYHHNVMLFPVGDKIAVVTILDREMLNEYIPESERGKIHFVMGSTRQALAANLNPQTTLDMTTLVEGKEWGEKTRTEIYGMGISGLMTSPIWFCQKIRDVFNGLL